MGTDWLAKERAKAAQRAELDEVGKVRLAQAWMNLYDDRARLREGIEEAVDLLNTPGGAGEALAVLAALVDWTEPTQFDGGDELVYGHSGTPFPKIDHPYEDDGRTRRCARCKGYRSAHIDGGGDEAGTIRPATPRPDTPGSASSAPARSSPRPRRRRNTSERHTPTSRNHDQRGRTDDH